MSLSQMDGCAALVQDCLNSSDPAEPLLTLCADPKPLAGLAEGDKPHPLVGIVTAMMAGALIDSGGPGDVEVVIERVAELSSRHATGPMFAAAFRRSRRRLPLSASRGHSYPPRFCRLPDGILGRAACRRWLRHQQRWTLPDDPILAPILAHPGIAAYGPFSIERGWLLDRRDATLASFKPDRNLERTSLFDELFILNALLSEQPERALAVIEKRGLLSAPEIVAVGDTSRGHLEFNAACVLAVLGRFEEALSRPYHGAPRYYTFWRFDLERAREMAWTQDMRQNEWLAFLAQTPAYRIFLDDYIRRRPFRIDDAACNLLCALREDIWDSKKKKRSWLSNRLVSPGEPVCARGGCSAMRRMGISTSRGRPPSIDRIGPLPARNS